MVSETDGSFLRSISRTLLTKDVRCSVIASVIWGTRALTIFPSNSVVGKSMCKCKQRRLSASERSRVSLLVRNTSGFERPLSVPSSGIDTWKSERTSRSSDSNSKSALSISSTSSTTPSSASIACIRGRGSKNSFEKKTSSKLCSRSTDSRSPVAPSMTSASWVFRSCVYSSCLPYFHS